MTVNHNPSWLRGILAKRTTDSVRVLSDLVEAGLRKGHCSANDVRDVKFAEPNVIGGTFKILHAFGFVKTVPVKATRKKRHGGTIFLWVLEDRAAAYRLVAEMRQVLFAAECREKATGPMQSEFWKGA